MTSELANAIRDALTSNPDCPYPVAVPTNDDIHVGPLVFRYGGGPKKNRWYILRDPHRDEN